MSWLDDSSVGLIHVATVDSSAQLGCLGLSIPVVFHAWLLYRMTETSQKRESRVLDSEAAPLHFYHILLVKASHEANLDSRGGDRSHLMIAEAAKSIAKGHGHGGGNSVGDHYCNNSP